MKILYQRVYWNNLFEVYEEDSNLFIFKNNTFWKAVNSLIDAITLINLGTQHRADALFDEYHSNQGSLGYLN